MTTPTTGAAGRGRLYRLAPLDRTGLMFGLTFGQLAIAAITVTVGSVVMVTANVAAGAAIIIVGATLSLTRLGGATIVDLAPHAARYVQHRTTTRRWFALNPIVPEPRRKRRRNPSPFEAYAHTSNHDIGGHSVVVSHDEANHTIAATIRVTGNQFSLLEHGEQDWLLAQWGTALQGFITEQSPVTSIKWSAHTSPTNTTEHRQWLHDHLAANPLTDAATAYGELLRNIETAARHEILVTLTTDTRQTRTNHHDTNPDNSSDNEYGAAVDVLATELRLFSQRLEAAGLNVSEPLNARDWGRAIERRLNPRTTLDLPLHQLAGVDPWPTATEHTWGAWHTDNTWHRALHVTEWPRLDVDARWLTDLMTYGGCTHAITVFYEPIPASVSRRAITRAAAKLESDTQQRHEHGLRVGAQHRRAAQAVTEREEELVAGYGEVAYAGLLTISAPTLVDLDAATDDLTQIAAAAGIHTKALHGRHDQAITATLPVARGLNPATHR